MNIDKVFGLPAHPLLVHAPIILIPVLALVALALAVKPAWRERFALPTAIAGLGVMVLTVLAAGAGEQLQRRVGDTPLVREHADLGGQTEAIMIVFAVALMALALAVWKNVAALLLPLAIVAAVAGVAATVWVVRTGHAGAKAVWQDVGKLTPRPEGG